jgi:hypothetical protein
MEITTIPTYSNFSEVQELYNAPVEGVMQQLTRQVLLKKLHRL